VIEGLEEGAEIALVDPTPSPATHGAGLGRRSRPGEPVKAPRISGSTSDFCPTSGSGFENLRAHALRSLLTMLGMIFGVAAVVAMLSIGAGAQQEVMAFIEQLGVRNLIVEAREAPDQQTLQKIRKLSAGLNFQDYRMIQANLEGITASTARKRFTPSKLLPKPQSDAPMVYGVSPGYTTIANLQVVPAASSTTRRPRRSAGRGARRGCRGVAVRRRRSDRAAREGQRAVVPGDRRRRPAADRADRRRRSAGAGPQQSDLRAALRGDLPARGRPEPAATRSTASTCRCARAPRSPAARRCCAAC
jgi:hypothetical protein